MDYSAIRKGITDAVSNGTPVDTSMFKKFGKDIGFYHRKTISAGTAAVLNTEFFGVSQDDLTSNMGAGGRVSAPFLASGLTINMQVANGAITLAKIYDLCTAVKCSRYQHNRDVDRVVDLLTEALFEVDSVVAGATDTANMAVRIKTKMKPINGELIFVPDNIFKGYLDVPALGASLSIDTSIQMHGLILR